MRTEFAQAMISLAEERDDLVFLTADLGYMALEQVSEALGNRFVNVGVAEQNAVSLAAGLASEGLKPWLYSMSAFTTLRPYAQIRDNVCLHKLPVKLVGNGGGYGYGIMGPTHHALEDLAVMRALSNMTCYVPLVSEDLGQVVREMAACPLPNYLRLNHGAQLPGDVAPFAGFRKLKSGSGAVLISTGPVVQGIYDMQAPELFEQLEVWSVGKFPLEAMPPDLVQSIEERPRVITMEEHGRAGGLGEALSATLLASGIALRSYTCLCAQGYPSGRYGSQKFHQTESELRGEGLVRRLREVLRG
jgi:transketolase